MSAKLGNPCHEVRIELPALVTGELDQTARAAVEAHLSFCPGWRARVREARDRSGRAEVLGA